MRSKAEARKPVTFRALSCVDGITVTVNYTQGVVHVRFCDTDKYSTVGLRVVSQLCLHFQDEKNDDISGVHREMMKEGQKGGTGLHVFTMPTSSN